MSKAIYLVGSNVTGEVKEHTESELDSLAKAILSDLNMPESIAPNTGEPHSYDYFFNERIITLRDDLTLIGYQVEDISTFDGCEFSVRSELVQF